MSGRHWDVQQVAFADSVEKGYSGVLTPKIQTVMRIMRRRPAIPNALESIKNSRETHVDNLSLMASSLHDQISVIVSALRAK